MIKKIDSLSPATTRFAPSPTGYLHLGHAYSAMFAENIARKTKGNFVLRIEDIDQSRCRPEFVRAICEDLKWLGLSWSGPLLKQSERFQIYQEVLEKLTEADLVYPCFCSRREIQIELESAVNAPHGPDGSHYPGTCRNLERSQREINIAARRPYSLRLDAQRAGSQAGPLEIFDLARGMIPVNPNISGDVILGRKEVTTSYHLAVTIDDAEQGVTIVTRGEDLLPASHIQRLLQKLIGLPETIYEHHRIIKGEDGKRLAKRHRSQTLKSLRDQGITPEGVRKKIGFTSS